MLMIPRFLLQDSFWAFLSALVAGALLASPILRLLIAAKSRQSVYNLAPETHQKKQGTPTMGGLVILAGAFVGMLWVASDWRVVLLMAGFAIIGFADDYLVPRLFEGKRGLGWKQKIAGEIALAVLAAPAFGIRFEVWPVLITAFLVLFFSNAYNFADGLDALAGSLGILLCLGFGAMGAFCGSPVLTLLCGALAGAFVPFLIMNAPPAKVFMGDVGSLPIGALFGGMAASLILQPRGFAALDWALVGPIVTLSVVMIAELLPVPMQVGYYKLTKKRLFPMTPIHHAFEKKGWPETRVVWSFVVVQFALAVVAIAWAADFKPLGLPSYSPAHNFYDRALSYPGQLSAQSLVKR